jgi:hypothetical protein
LSQPDSEHWPAKLERIYLSYTARGDLTVKNLPRLLVHFRSLMYSENPESLIAPAGNRLRAFCVSDNHLRLRSVVATSLQGPRTD